MDRVVPAEVVGLRQNGLRTLFRDGQQGWFEWLIRKAWP
jgi:hypothetical protein